MGLGLGLWRLTWIETKVFVREPLGVVGTVAVPVLVFLVFGRMMGGRLANGPASLTRFAQVDLPIFAAILMAFSAVMSLITIVSIYRDSGVLKRLRATPIAPVTILAANVLVKLLFTTLTLVVLAVAGRQYYPVDVVVPWLTFLPALLLSTVSILTLGFIIASLVPTARFAQPIATLVFYPMLGLSGLFIPVADLPAPLQAVAHLLPVTYATSLLRGVWLGDSLLAHALDITGLVAIGAVCAAIAARFFRWE
jgi:ABC-2 type transport system permease protein